MIYIFIFFNHSSTTYSLPLKSEFAPVEDDASAEGVSNESFENPTESKHDAFESPLMNRMKGEQSNSWDTIRRQQSQQQQQQQQQSSGKSGLTYEELRKRNRIGFNKRADDQQQNETGEVPP